jgi:hypothetical protein
MEGSIFGKLNNVVFCCRSSIPGRGKIFFSILQRLDQLWGPPSLLINGYRGALSPGAKRPVTTHFHLMLRSRMVALYLHSPIRLHGVLLNWLTAGATLPLSSPLPFNVLCNLMPCCSVTTNLPYYTSLRVHWKRPRNLIPTAITREKRL